MAGLNDPLTQLDYGVEYARGPQSITQQTGLAGLAAPANLDIARANQGALNSLADLGNMQIAAPPPSAAPRGPVLAISRSSGQIWANGKLFTLDDAQGALDSQQYLSAAPAPAPAAAAGDWEPLDIEAYSQHIEQIKNPGLGTLASKNFGIGVDNMQMLGGYGLQFLGAEETGRQIVQSQLGDLAKNAPYQRNFEDIGSDPNRGVLDWFVANLAQQGPNIVESAVTAAIGAVAGGAAGGGPNPATAVGGAVTAMVGKTAFKQAMLSAAKKYMAGEVLDAAEKKLLYEAAGITAAGMREAAEKAGVSAVNASGQGTVARSATQFFADEVVPKLGQAAQTAATGGLAQARMGGAAIATGLQNYATGVADLYGESVEGGDPSRGFAMAGGIPYAAMESLPEFVAALRIFKGVGARTTALAGKSAFGKAGEIATRAGIGAGAGAALEGTTELGQEGLGIAANDAIDIDSPEGLSRMLNAFAAGAAIGGFIGAGSNMNTGKPHDLLSAGSKPADQSGQTILSGEVIPPTRPSGLRVPDGSVPLLGGPGSGAAAPTLGGPAPAGPVDVTNVSFAQPQVGVQPGAPVSPAEVVTPTPGQSPVNMLPGASTIYQGQDPSVQPPLALTGPAPVAPTGPAPASAAPPVINAPGPEQYGSALSQAAAGDLPGAVPPPSPALNRLQQIQQQARTQSVEANSQSALAQTARAGGVASPTLAQLLQQKEAAGQSAPASKGKAKLAKPKAAVPNTTDVPAAPVGKAKLAAKVAAPVAAPAPAQAKLQKGKAVQKVAEETSSSPVHDKYIAELDDARMNLATKKELRSLTTRALKAGVLTQADLKEVEPMFKDRDMSADDIVPELTGMIERNKEAAPIAETPKAEPKPREIKPEKKFSFSPKEEATVSEAPSPKAEGAAAAPSQKAEKVSKEVLRNAGWTDSEIRDYQNDRPGARSADTAARGYTHIGGEYRAITAEDVRQAEESANRYQTEELPKLIEKIRKKFADARAKYRDFGPNGTLANVIHSDDPAVTEAEAIKRVENDYVIRSVKKLAEHYKLTDEYKAAQEAPKPSQALAVIENKPFIDPVVEARLKRQQEEEAEIAALSQQDDMAEIEDLIVSVNTNDPDSVEYKDSLSALLEYAKDGSISKTARARATEYIENEFDADEIKLFQRSTKNPVTQAELDFSTITTAMEQINNGEIKLTQKLVGILVSAWKRIKSGSFKYGDQPLAAYINGGPNFFNMKDGKVVPKGEGRFSTTLWDKPDPAFTVGKLQLVINKFTSKLAMKPTVYVYKDQADLKAQNPKLHAKLAAGRPGDFDTTVAAGYSMGDTIVIFSDRIGSEQHLAFVLAHETLGHFGLRGLMPKSDFDAVMTALYGTDARLTAAVDAAMARRKMSKAEAVEEYLADYAAQLHTSLVKRAWNGLKGVLNRVGIRFGDEAMRYILSQSKRYVKTGEATGMFETSSVMHRLWGVENGQVGRFSTAETMNEQDRISMGMAFNAPFPMDLQQASRMLGGLNLSWDVMKEKFFSLANYQALRNPGLYAFDKLMDETRQHEQSIFNKYNAKLETLLMQKEGHRDTVSRLLLLGRSVATNRLLKKPLSPEEHNARLFTLNSSGDLELDETSYNELLNKGLVSFDEFKNGVEYSVEIMEGDKLTYVTKKADPMPDLTKEQYDDYVLARRTIADVEMELLKAKYANVLHYEKVSTKAIKKMLRNSKVGDEADKLVKRTARRYKEIYVSGYKVDNRGNLEPGRDEINRANDFLEAVNRALIDAKVDGKPDKAEARKYNDKQVRKFFEEQKQADDFMAQLEVLRDNRKTPDSDISFLFQNEMKRIVLDDVNLGVEEERAKRTLAAGYVPVIRDKGFEVRLQALDENGDPVSMHEEHKRLFIYSQVDSLRAAQNAAEMLDKEIGGKTYEVMVRQDDGTYKLQNVRFKAKSGIAAQQVSADPSLNLDEFLHGLRTFDINLTPDRMSEVIRTLTASGSQLRKKMQFSDTPGVDKTSGVFAMARHIQLRAATVAKTITRPRTRELMDRDNREMWDLWTGDTSGIFSTYERWSKETDPDIKTHYKHQLDHKVHMFVETYPDAKGWDGSKAGYDQIKDKLTQENYNRFYDQAQRTLGFLEGNTLVSDSNFGAGKVASNLRAITSILQLGGSIAQGMMNMVSPYTNWMPYMASYNARTGFGGGFSTGKVVAAYHTALRQVGAPGLAGFGSTKYNTAEFYEELIRDPAKLAKSGLTSEEAQFLADEIREGKLIPAQSNALLGTARTGWVNPLLMRGVDAFMSPFNRTEQASRRAAALAAFRLAYARVQSNTKMDAEEKLQAARDFAIQSLDLTLGDYSVLNRPPAWRDGVQSFLYMYKVYPTTTIQLLRRLDKKGQIIMLGTLWMFAGVMGFPFAEDIEDLIDTIAQALGLQMGSVRAEFTKILEGLVPGLSPYVLKGAVNTALGVPADVASRFSMGDFVPGSGILLAGSTVGQEIKEIVGPMPSMVLGMGTFAKDVVSFPFSSTVSLQDTLRASPITAARMVGDTWAYASNGAVVDKRGYVVSPDMTIGTMAARLMGFYPKAAADQYEAIRVAKRVSNYQKEVVAAYRTAWVQAMMQGNRAYARQIEQSVDAWNRDAKGTQLEISNFRKNSERALKEAKSTAVQRTLKSTSKAGRPEAQSIMDYMIE